MSSRTIIIALLCAGLLGTTGVRAQEPVFDGDRAFAWLVRQVELGPRVPGTAGNRALREIILATADSLGVSGTTVCLEVTDPLGGEQVEICNVVVRIAGDGSSPAAPLWLGAHFDTRPVADQDPDPARRGLPVPGANDGASGTAVLLHLMEILAASRPATDVLLLFFDGEDSGRQGAPGGFCLGSSHLAATRSAFGSPLAGPEPRGLVLLDMVGEADLRIPMEGYSLRYAPAWTAAVFDRAASLGLSAFAAEPGRAVYDDHVPFLQAGVPSVDLIDFDFPQWHTVDDTPAVCSPVSLAQVGSLVLDLALRP